jgi:hypothetical protein
MLLWIRQHAITNEITVYRGVWIDFQSKKEEDVLKMIRRLMMCPKLSTHTVKWWHSTFVIIICANLVLWKSMINILLQSELLNPRLFTQMHSSNNLKFGFKSEMGHGFW